MNSKWEATNRGDANEFANRDGDDAVVALSRVTVSRTSETREAKAKTNTKLRARRDVCWELGPVSSRCLGCEQLLSPYSISSRENEGLRDVL